MDLIAARHIIESLADGIDPSTGEVFGPGSPLEAADVVRALHVALNAIDSQIRTQERRSSKQSLPNAGKAWSPEEDREVVSAFESGRPISAIARSFGRTEDSIAARLVRLGKVQDRHSARVANRSKPD
jgi:hypothetical protein